MYIEKLEIVHFAHKTDVYTSIAQDSLSYVRLRDMVSRRPSLLVTAIQHVMKLLKSEVSHTGDYGDREALLPLLQLFRELLIMVRTSSLSLSLSLSLSFVGHCMWCIVYLLSRVVY